MNALEMLVSSVDFDDRCRAFARWHQDNPMIWKYFERFAFEAVHRGRRKISHWLIVNRIRWEVSIVTTGADFKISNDMIAFYARLWRAKHSQHRDLFNVKHILGEPDDPLYVLRFVSNTAS